VRYICSLFCIPLSYLKWNQPFLRRKIPQISQIIWLEMDRKRKRRRSESSSGLNGQLCEKCSCIFATVENLRKLATWPGFKHHGEIELRDYARDGCTLCALFYEKLKPKDQEGKNVGSLFLSPLAHHGETPLRTTAKSRYPGVIMNTSCLYGRWEIGDSQKHTFDIVSAQG
jgi:hypothetical protein